MPDYGDVSYWNDRYSAEYTENFDWLFEYKDISEIIPQLFNYSSKILMIGSGNATFSNDLYQAGYKNITNIDLSSVVIHQMKKRYPMMEWHVMDALDMSFPSGSQQNIIDKSLIDTILCYQNSIPCTKQLIREIYRVLAPGGILLCFSLHSISEILSFFQLDGMEWSVQTFLLRNPRWDREEASKRSVVHSIVVAQKPPLTISQTLNLRGTISQEEYLVLKAESDKICEDIIFSKAKTQDLVNALDKVLQGIQEVQDNPVTMTSYVENYEQSP